MVWAKYSLFEYVDPLGYTNVCPLVAGKALDLVASGHCLVPGQHPKGSM